MVGAGAAGLAAAHQLSAQHDVTLFEASARPGGHAWTIDVPRSLADPAGEQLGVDVGFLVLNDRNYPRFEALLAELGVPSQPSDMSFSVSDGRDFEYAGSGLGALFANRRHLVDPGFVKMVGEYVRFNRDAKKLMASDADPSLRQWLTDEGYSERFVEGLIVPQASAVWSADPEQLWTFPARFLVQFFANHGMLGFRDRPQWRTVTGGSRQYVEAICARLGDRVRLATPVQAVRRTAEGVEVVTAAGGTEAFDEVVLACHSDQALALLAEPTPAEREVLGAFPYLASELVLHHDVAMLPRRRAAWASWNHHLLTPTPPLPTVTYWLNNLQGHVGLDRELLVTLNRTADIDPAKVHAVVDVAHPVFTPDGVRAQGRWAEVSGADRVHFAGAYWSWGFHEDGISSGYRVAEAIAARPAPELALA